MSDLWVFKYMPQTLDELVVSEENKKKLQYIMGNLPNSLLTGPPGTGKSSFVDILIRQKQLEYLKVNASLDTGIDIVREKIFPFSKAYSPDGIKLVYINEAERLSKNAIDSLLDLQESVQKITRFIFVSNDERLRNDADGAMKSRCSSHVILNDPPAKQIYNKCMDILKKENVKLHDKRQLINLVKTLYPDVRKTIGVLQSNVSNGEIRNISYSTNSDLYEKIWDKMKEGDVEDVRKQLKSNYIDYPDLYNYIYSKVMDDPDEVKSPGEFMIEVGEALYRDNIVAIKEINFMSFMFKLLKESII